ncbi:MAG: hypothetical protein HY909_19570 [Deltaproteobacteria bacterium]|nr:hypothetical protein [Deltaproteobacteria bacterium]
MAHASIIGNVGLSSIARGVLCAALLGCAPLDDDPAGGISSEPAALTAVTGVTSGYRTAYFTATSSTSLTLTAGTTLTQVSSPSGTVTYRINNNNGGITCRCDGGCAGGCEAVVGDLVATCSGSCSGLSSDGVSCSSRGCTWHYSAPSTRLRLR